MTYLGMLIVLYIVYRTLLFARKTLSEGNWFGAAGIGLLCAGTCALAVYQFFIR